MWIEEDIPFDGWFVIVLFGWFLMEEVGGGVEVVAGGGTGSLTIVRVVGVLTMFIEVGIVGCIGE